MDKVTILCSGFGLGFYIPGIMLRNQLANRNVCAEVDVFENYMEPDKKENIDTSRDAYHQNFARAIVASKIPMDIRKSIDHERVNELIHRWKAEGRERFVLLSGHWIYIMDMYREIAERPLAVDLLYVDSAYAPSWKSFYKLNPGFHKTYREINLYDRNQNKMNYTIGVDGFEVKDYRKREKKLVVHGGGWGMGTYREKIPDLLENGYFLDIVAYKESENQCDKQIQYRMNDRHWCAWEKDRDTSYDFPPYIEFIGDQAVKRESRKENHWLLDVTNEARGIVAKPGAGTLLDSFITETPLVILEAFGAHEKSNHKVWETLGFGVTYADWAASGYSEDVLLQLHNNISRYKENVILYADTFV